MLLRVPDYYFEFSCIADRCRDSCCIGWEIDIDPETCEYYHRVPGKFGERLKKNMYVTPEGENSFRLAAKGRCPFLNACNLCDIYTELGEEALSEVCTEYPRFTIEYGDVLQKCLSLSCEEVGRLVFTRKNPVEIREEEIPHAQELSEAEENNAEADNIDETETDEIRTDGIETDGIETDEIETDEIESNRIKSYNDMECDCAADEAAWYAHMEKLQGELLSILKDRSRSLSDRITEYLSMACSDPEPEQETDSIPYEDFQRRIRVFYEMETLDDEWRQVKSDFRKFYTLESYEKIVRNFRNSPAYLESDYEQLMVYFTFRYLMNAVFDYDVSTYAKLSVIFTLVIRDMDALRYEMQGEKYSRNDRIDTARIFSKEVEHSQDNVDLVREECLFEETFETGNLIRQIQNI